MNTLCLSNNSSPFSQYLNSTKFVYQLTLNAKITNKMFHDINDSDDHTCASDRIGKRETIQVVVVLP